MEKIQKRWDEFNKECEQEWRGLLVEFLEKSTIPYIVDLVNDRIKESFEGGVTKFYEDYTPSSYKRRESLYDVMHITKYDDLGIPYIDTNDVAESLAQFIDENGSPFTDEDHFGKTPPYETFLDVFFDGYHGGASSIDESKTEKYGEHPNPGTPYWRWGYYRYFPTREKVMWSDMHKWWGSPAGKADPSPMMYFSKDIEKWIDTSLKKEITRKVLKAFEMVNKGYLPIYKRHLMEEFFT